MAAERPIKATSAGVRKSMQANKGRDTRPEWEIRRRVHAAGLRYRVSARPIPGFRRTADLVFSRAKVAVFVDGCFWHGCPEHHTVAKANAEYWSEKVQRNRERDQETNDKLVDSGWKVIRIWEHEDPREGALKVINAVRSALDERG